MSLPKPYTVEGDANSETIELIDRMLAELYDTISTSSGTGVTLPISLTTGVSGILPLANGGTGLSTVVQGDVIYASAADTLARLAKNTTATRYLSNTGAGNNPAWALVNLSNGITGTLFSGNGGLGNTGQATGDLLYGDLTVVQVWSRLGITTVDGRFLRKATVAGLDLPQWSTLVLPNAATVGDLLHCATANVYTSLADVATGSVLISGGVGTVPAWSASPVLTTQITVPKIVSAADLWLAPTNDVKWGPALIALGGGAAATLGTIGGTGPATAGQNTWMRVLDSTGAAFWVPAWK